MRGPGVEARERSNEGPKAKARRKVHRLGSRCVSEAAGEVSTEEARPGVPGDPVSCPECLSDDVEVKAFDFGICPQTGYRDAGERFHCRECGAQGDADDMRRASMQG